MVPVPENEAERLRVLDALQLIDTAPESHFDAVCRTAADLFSVPIVLISLMAEDRQWFKAKYGLALEGTSRADAFCAWTLASGEILVVRDARLDPRFVANPLVTGEPGIRFYAGAPLAVGAGLPVGTICLIDTVPRRFTRKQAARLRDLAEIVVAHLKLHEARLASERALQDRRRADALLAAREDRIREAERLQAMAEQVACVGHWRIDAATRTIRWSDGVARIFGRALDNRTLSLDAHLSLYLPEDGAKVGQLMAAALSGSAGTEGETFQHRSRLTRPDGEIRFLSVRGAVEHDAAGRVTGLFGVCMDVTDVVRSERELREAGDLLRMTLESMDQGLVMVGPDDRVRVHNERARALLGLDEGTLGDGCEFEGVRRLCGGRGGSGHPDGPMRDGWATAGVSGPRTFEHHQQDGAVLEVRAVPLPNGGSVFTFADVTGRKAGERAVLESERRYRLLAENTTDIIILCELDTTRLYVSPAAQAVFGYDAEDLVGTRPLGFVHPDDVEAYRRLLDDLVNARVEQAVSRQRYRHKDGSWIWIEATFSLTRDELTGEPNGYVASLRDIGDRQAAEDALRQSEERLALALQSGNDGLWDWNAEPQQLWFSERLSVLLGFDPGELAVSFGTWQDLLHPDDRSRVMRLFEDHLKGAIPIYESEQRLRRKDGGYAWVLARGRVVERDAKGRALRVIGTHIDVTARKEAERRIAHMAGHDGLTDLPNRARFHERLKQQLVNVGRSGETCALLYLDLDRFKAVNDTLGHQAGDALLCEVARRFRATVRAEDMVARLGGDEFAVLQIHDPAQSASAAALARRLVEVVSRPIVIGGQRIEVGVSIGIALAPWDGADADALVNHADLALYRAKADGRNTWRFYEAAMDEAVEAKRTLEADLRGAVARGEFEVHYQPIVCATSTRATGVEALVRWRHPVRGLVPPSDFIPLAEETGLIVPLGAWVLRTACRDAVAWPEAIRVAVNISAVQFSQAGLVDTVMQALAASGLPAGRLELEITESVLMQDGSYVLDTLHHLRGLGLRTALDDFGTGFSSLSYLRRFPFDKLKIDRSFVQDIDNPGTASIVSAVVDLGLGLGMSVTAEGVETEMQLASVRAKGCTEVQGYFFSKPVSASQVAAFVNEGQARNAA
jgi:diguanylate cyclase (GGDEF)-like protein/PAS domain S-box-containing protein